VFAQFLDRSLRIAMMDKEAAHLLSETQAFFLVAHQNILERQCTHFSAAPDATRILTMPLEQSH
jgi:hypothetical protein